MTQLAHSLVVGADQDVNHVLDTEALLNARDAGENFLREHGRIGEALDLVKADVARGAVRTLISLAEVGRERRMTASKNCGESEHVLQELSAALRHFGKSRRFFGGLGH